ncbi:MAG: alpha/beta hydrolase [Spirochaetia bacterium]
MLRENVYDTGEVVLNVAVGEPTGAPLLMMHGATLNWQSFEPFFEELEPRWQLFAVDFRGHGKSGHPSSGYHAVDCLRDTIALIDKLTDRPVVAMGFSLGASIALGLAATVPGRVRAVVSIEPGLSLREASTESLPELYGWLTWLVETKRTVRSFDDIVMRCKRNDPNLDDAGAQLQAHWIHDTSPEVAAIALRNELFEQYDHEGMLSRMKCPALLVRGDPALGGCVRDCDAALVTRCAPGTMIRQVPNAGHMLLWGEPGQQTLGHVRAFLSSL